MKGSFLGPSYSNDEIKSYLKNSNLDFEFFSDELLFNKVSRLISEGNIIGWFQGRMEFGPRALGARSILGDPRNSEMQKKMNLKIKFRESFRPFAPCILEDDLENWFNTSEKNEYMLVVSSIIEKRRLKPDWSLNGLKKLNFAYSDIPAVTHVDYSARVQTVSKKNIRLYSLLKAFKELTNCPVLINTSFNLNGEPIVMTPEDACKCFLKTNIDYLVLENFLVKK
jgi:carbamoyltransferase